MTDTSRTDISRTFILHWNAITR